MLPLYQMESYDVSSKLLQRLNRKTWRHTVKHCLSAAVFDQCAHRYNTVAGQLIGVDAIYKLRILEDDQIQFGLGHTPQRQLEYSVPTVTDIIQSEPYWCLGFVPSLAPLPPPHILPRNPAHYLLTVTFSPPLPPATL